MSAMRSSTEVIKTAKGWPNGVKASNARIETTRAPPISHEQCEVLYSALQDVCTLITQGVMANTAILSLHYADTTTASVEPSDTPAPTLFAKKSTTNSTSNNRKSCSSNDNVQTNSNNAKSTVAGNSVAAEKPPMNGRSTYISASVRLAALRQGIHRLKSLQDVLEEGLLYSALGRSRTGAANTRAVVARLSDDSMHNAKAATIASTINSSSSGSTSQPKTSLHTSQNVHATDTAAEEDAMNALAALRASANARMFAEECHLSLPLSEYRISDKDRLRYADDAPSDVAALGAEDKGGNTTSARVAVVNKGDSPNTEENAAAADVHALDAAEEDQVVHTRLQPLVALLQQIHGIRNSLGSTPPAQSIESQFSATTSHSSTCARTVQQHTEPIIHALQSALESSLTTLRENYARCGCSTSVIQCISSWPRGLLRLFNETVHREPLTHLVEATAEKLRRIRFDAEELEQEQQQAVNDGDMHRSEALYFQQVTLLESVKPYFDKLEAIITNYRVTHAEKPVEQLRQFQQSFRSSVASTTSKEKSVAQKAHADLAKLTQRQLHVAQLRDAQWAGLQLYREEWNRVFDDNASQQMSCLKAMEELERRLANLAQEQSFLVRDRMAKVRLEAQREADAMAFFHFVRRRTAALAQSLVCSEGAIGAMDSLSCAIESSCSLFDTFLTDTVKGGIDEELVRVRTERLDQFRSLYLTLGDLHYKKSRHAEEIAKKIEYFGLQQEIAMDELNPKAKEFSQSKRKWQDVQNEIHSQIHMLESRSQKQLDDFRPTEQLLLEAKVAFKHPRDELQERNLTRTQRLLEYKKLMEDVAEVPESNSASNSKNDKVGSAAEDNVTSSSMEARTQTFGLSTDTNESVRAADVELGSSQSSTQVMRRKSPALSRQSAKKCESGVRTSTSTR